MTCCRVTTSKKLIDVAEATPLEGITFIWYAAKVDMLNDPKPMSGCSFLNLLKRLAMHNLWEGKQTTARKHVSRPS